MPKKRGKEYEELERGVREERGTVPVQEVIDIRPDDKFESVRFRCITPNKFGQVCGDVNIVINLRTGFAVHRIGETFNTSASFWIATPGSKTLAELIQSPDGVEEFRRNVVQGHMAVFHPQAQTYSIGKTK